MKLLLYILIFLLSISLATAFTVGLTGNLTGYNFYGIEAVTDVCTDGGVCLESVGGGNTTFNQSLTDSLYAPINTVSDNVSWNQVLANTLYSPIGISTDNASWNESYANSLYLKDISINATPSGNSFYVGPIVLSTGASSIGYRTFDISLETIPNSIIDSDLSEIGNLSCSNGQIIKQSGGAWTCAADDNSVSGGSSNITSMFKPEYVLPGYVFSHINQSNDAVVYKPVLEERTESCSTTYAGLQRYNYTSNAFQYCNSTSWVTI